MKYLFILLILLSGCSAPLHRAIKKGNVTKAQTIINQKPEQISKVQGFDNPLMLAARYDRIEIVQLLIEAGVDINKGNEWGYTPLHTACNYSSPEIQRLLVEKGAIINVKDWRGLTPLMIAAIKNNIDLVRLLIDRGADVRAVYKNENPKHEKSYTYETALHYAAMNKNRDIAHLLINSGADVNHRNKKLQTPLFIAVLKKDDEMVRLLVNSETDVNLQNKELQSPLYVACLTNQNELAKFLISSGAVVSKLEGSADELYYTAVSFRMFADCQMEKKRLQEAQKNYLSAAEYFEKAGPQLMDKSKYYKKQKNLEKILVGMEAMSAAMSATAAVQGKLSPYEQVRLRNQKERKVKLTVEQLAFLEKDYADRANYCQEASKECRQKAKQLNN